MQRPQSLLDRQGFIDRINRWAEKHDAPTVTDRMLQDWNEQAILPAATPVHGNNSGVPLWFYDWWCYYRALLICRLKKQHRKRYSELRTILWFRGIEIPGGPPRDDLAAEYERCVKTLLRPINSTYNPSLDENESQTRVVRLRKQLGKQAPVFKGTFLEANDDRILAGYKEGRFAEPQNILREFEDTALDGLLTEWGSGRDGAPEAYWPPGLMAHPDENGNAGIDLIKCASDDELIQAREIFRAFMNLPALMGLLENSGENANLKMTRELFVSIAALKYSITHIPAWRLVLLVNFLAFGKQAPNRAKSVENSNNTMISMYCAMISGIKGRK